MTSSVSHASIFFPHPFYANKDGLLALGGDLSSERLILAYRFGIFPWYNEDQPILWWTPRERFIIDSDRLHVPKSMRRYLNHPFFKITVDEHFEHVIDQCQNIVRPGQDGTWITPELKLAYLELHRQGIAHSVEIWYDNQIVGGLYGIAIGRIFSGESMFSLVTDASKYAVIALNHILLKKGFLTIDCQQYSRHMEMMGGYTVSYTAYFKKLRKNLFSPLERHHWSADSPAWHELKK